MEGLGWVTPSGGPLGLALGAARRAAALALQAGVAGRLVARHGVCGVLVGHPLDPLGGRSGAECEFAEALAASLEDSLLRTEQGGSAPAACCPVLLWDERGSSVQAREALRRARLEARRGAFPREALPRALGGKVDQAAAGVILQSFLGTLPLS